MNAVILRRSSFGEAMPGTTEGFDLLHTSGVKGQSAPSKKAAAPAPKAGDAAEGAPKDPPMERAPTALSPPARFPPPPPRSELSLSLLRPV